MAPSAAAAAAAAKRPLLLLGLGLLLLLAASSRAEELALPWAAWTARAGALLQGAEEGQLDPQAFVTLRETVRSDDSSGRDGTGRSIAFGLLKKMLCVQDPHPSIHHPLLYFALSPPPI